jgi:hypothetical protein
MAKANQGELQDHCVCGNLQSTTHSSNCANGGLTLGDVAKFLSGCGAPQIALVGCLGALQLFSPSRQMCTNG